MIALGSVTAFLKLADEYNVLKAAYWANREEVRDLLGAIPQASNAAWQRDKERADEIKLMIDTPDVSEGAKRMYRRELEALRAKSYGASEADTDDFNELISEMEQQAAELSNLRRRIRAAADVVDEDISDIKAQTCGDKHGSYYRDWNESDKKKFASRCQHYTPPEQF